VEHTACHNPVAHRSAPRLTTNAFQSAHIQFTATDLGDCMALAEATRGCRPWQPGRQPCCCHSRATPCKPRIPEVRGGATRMYTLFCHVPTAWARSPPAKSSGFVTRAWLSGPLQATNSPATTVSLSSAAATSLGSWPFLFRSSACARWREWLASTHAAARRHQGARQSLEV
jgi:hypothetical protein